MMDGEGGASPGSLALVQLNSDGTTQATFQYPDKAVVTLDGEFWLYGRNGRIQRFDPNSGNGYGTPYVLPIRPQDEDVKWFFAAAGALWMLEGNQLALLDVPTGPARKDG
jgi:hypothetical protein